MSTRKSVEPTNSVGPFATHGNKCDILSDISAGIDKLGRCRIDSLNVFFICPDGSEYDFSLSQALEALASDLYFDDRGNWSDAERARVEVM